MTRVDNYCIHTGPGKKTRVCLSFSKPEAWWVRGEGGRCAPSLLLLLLSPPPHLTCHSRKVTSCWPFASKLTSLLCLFNVQFRIGLWLDSVKYFILEGLGNLEPGPGMPIFLNEGYIGSISLIHVFIQLNLSWTHHKEILRRKLKLHSSLWSVLSSLL